uniref:Uncharacterized protein n=1 Tax=Mycena chlorophos TaxID=658473 RepID=A0ABQ0L9P0_MYCCL|nr:predicted protein [Mycena chlorophos]
MPSWRRLVAPIYFALLPFTLSFVAASSAPQAINGQIFTDGLAIIDAPAPNSTEHAGATLPIAIDVSGNGQMPLAASVPASGRATGFNSLEIYLVSSQTNLNLTVSSNSSLLDGEPTSTVKHLNYGIPQCVPAGNYNLTFYEASTLNSQFIFAITGIPMTIENSSPSGTCSGNPLLPQPQPDVPLNQSPFNPDPVFTLTLTLSGGSFDLPTVTTTQKGTPTTVVVVSPSTVLTTVQGSPVTFTTTRTWSTVVTMATNADDTSGFVPVNAATKPRVASTLGVFASAVLSWHVFM